MKSALRIVLMFLIGIWNTACESSNANLAVAVSEEATMMPPKDKYRQLFDRHAEYKADGFDYPVGKPSAKGYYNAQGFGGKSHHLGDDWNATTGGNSDLGHPIYAISNGYVSRAEDHKGGWGNVIRVVHDTDSFMVESLYAHCQKMLVKQGDWIKRGQQIGTIGNNRGMYYAHLHLEIRSQVDLPLGGGYSRLTKGYLDPTVFIKAFRPE